MCERQALHAAAAPALVGAQRQGQQRGAGHHAAREHARQVVRQRLRGRILLGQAAVHAQIEQREQRRAVERRQRADDDHFAHVTGGTEVPHEGHEEAAGQVGGKHDRGGAEARGLPRGLSAMADVTGEA